MIAHLVGRVAETGVAIWHPAGSQDQEIGLFFFGAGEDRVGRLALAKERRQPHTPRAGEVGGGLEEFFQATPRLNLDILGKLIRKRMAHVFQDRYRGHLAVVLLGQIDRGLQGLFTATRIVQCY
jgi:hypothetical protein